MTRKEFLQLALLIASQRDGASRTAAEVNRLTALFDSVATDRADVVLRYWDEVVTSPRLKRVKPACKAAA